MDLLLSGNAITPCSMMLCHSILIPLTFIDFPYPNGINYMLKAPQSPISIPLPSKFRRLIPETQDLSYRTSN